MNYANIKPYDIANGLGIRVSLFVSGCRHHCPNCFNPETWDFDYGNQFTNETINTIIQYLSYDYIDGLSLLGGEPMEKENQDGLVELIAKVKQYYPNKTIWCYTGYTFEYLIGKDNKLLPYLDVIVDGRYMEKLKDISLQFRGSSNQRIIDVQESLRQNRTILWNERTLNGSSI